MHKTEDINTWVLMGRPGSGKGTQAKRLVDALGAQYFATGDTFRKLAAEDTPLGRKVHDTIANGVLMPHWFASYIVDDAVLRLDDNKTLILDGTNRTLPEAQHFYEVMEWIGRPFRVVYLDVPEEVITARIIERAAEGSGREDDTEENVRVRIREYDGNTEPALQFLTEKGLVTRVNGQRDIDIIQQELLAIIKGGVA